MRRTRVSSLAFGLLAAGLLCAGSVEAQVTGTLRGHVSDQSGARLPDASVVIRDTERGAERRLTTNSQGYYTAPLLQPGVYSIEASSPGFRSILRENVRLLVGQVLDINLQLSVAQVAEVVTVAAESPAIEVTRSSTAHYVSEREIENLPIAGRDFTDFALLEPTVKTEPIRGGVSLSGQKGISSGINIDGTEAKSAFFGYGRGGEATENDGLVISQDSVKEFQVIINGFAPEYGRSGGGYLNVVTKSGSNTLKGSGFFFFRNDSLAADLKPTDLDVARGLSQSDPRFQVSDFTRKNWGASLGGPIQKDKTHFFVSYDQLQRDEPFVRDIRGAGQYDAVLSRFPGLLKGFSRNPDGTATGQFNRTVDNLILFGKITHQINQNHNFSVRYNLTDYERRSDYKGEESLKKEKTHSVVGSFVSVLGPSVVNEFRFQYARDNLDRLSNLDPDDITAQFRIFAPSFGGFGKPDFLPIFVREEKFQFRNDLSYSFGSHDAKFGVDLNVDKLSEFFAGSFDGRYDFNTVEDFLANNASRARIFYGAIEPPPAVNFEVTQQTLGLYAQDTWRASPSLTLNYGMRWEGTFNPGGFEHALPEGREIPDDLDNFAPRLGLTWSPGGDASQVFRIGGGRFFSRTPTLIFFDVVQSNGIPPNFGRVVVSAGEAGFVPLGQPINHQNPPAGIDPALGIVDPSFEDAATWRFNAGYEREIATDWTAGLDFSYATSDNLQSSFDVNVLPPTYDQFGRPIYSRTRPRPQFANIGTRLDISRSKYLAGTISISKRWSKGYQVQAHYTLAEDKDNDSNERSATSVTLTDFTNPDYDYGLSERDVRHRFVFSGLAELPLGLKLSAIATIQSGAVYTALDPNTRLTNHPTTTLQPRAVIDGRLAERNSFRGPSLKNLDVRLSKVVELGGARLEAIFEAFNVFNTGNFFVGSATDEFYLRDGVTRNREFGIAGSRAEGPTFGNQRQFQLGARFSF